jgi:ring-1,2-phenylacetyl-CoA epoxidase subunit PaaB
MKTQSLDPRINRMQMPEYQDEMQPKILLDQFATYEVFQQFKDGKPYEHVGIVHAPNEDMAFLFAKEQYTRRGPSCTGMFIVKTAAIQVTPYTDGDKNVLDLFQEYSGVPTHAESYEVFFLKKRGKQHVHVGSVQADNHSTAVSEAAKLYPTSPCVNVWVTRRDDVLFSQPEDKDIWSTLSEKKYREAVAYRAMDRINQFKAEQKQLQ